MMLTHSQNYLGVALLAAGDLDAARRAFAEGIQRAWQYRFYYNLMVAFYHFARLLVAEERVDPVRAPERAMIAITLLSFMQTQVSTWQFYKDKAADLQGDIARALPADLCASAISRGQTSTLEEMVHTALAEFERC